MSQTCRWQKCTRLSCRIPGAGNGDSEAGKGSLGKAVTPRGDPYPDPNPNRHIKFREPRLDLCPAIKIHSTGPFPFEAYRASRGELFDGRKKDVLAHDGTPLNLTKIPLKGSFKLMEKRKPHYSLKDIQEKVRLYGEDVFTRTALENSKEMGLTIKQTIEVVCSMKQSCFYKSMTTHASIEIWQDVYHSQPL